MIPSVSAYFLWLFSHLIAIIILEENLYNFHHFVITFYGHFSSGMAVTCSSWFSVVKLANKVSRKRGTVREKRHAKFCRFHATWFARRQSHYLSMRRRGSIDGEILALALRHCPAASWSIFYFFIVKSSIVLYMFRICAHLYDWRWRCRLLVRLSWPHVRTIEHCNCLNLSLLHSAL